MSIEQKKFKRLRKELQFLQSELEYVNEVLQDWHQKFEKYQREYCENKNIDLAKLNEKNKKKVNQIIPQPVKEETGLVKYDNSMQKNGFKKLYKQIARKLHPDLGGDKNEFQEVQEAMQDKNFEKILDICDKHDIVIEIDKQMIKLLEEQIKDTKAKISKEKSTYSWSLYSCDENQNCKDNVIKKFLKHLFGYQEKVIKI